MDKIQASMEAAQLWSARLRGVDDAMRERFNQSLIRAIQIGLNGKPWGHDEYIISPCLALGIILPIETALKKCGLTYAAVPLNLSIRIGPGGIEIITATNGE